MSKRTLPVIEYSPFRKYPTRADKQSYADDRDVCKDCLSGVCCLSEEPIYLSSFDVFRLSAFFNMSPAQFLINFTQDRFGGEDSDTMRRPYIDDPNCSTMTYLRRRDNTPTSPCIFLKYVRESDGTPRRICSVYDARPLACREFYFDTCKTRGTGEQASLLAEGFEKVRDRIITEEIVDAQLTSLQAESASSATLAGSFEYCFWVEMKRVINMDQANVEGSNSYNIANSQDSIDQKLNRVLSARYLRYEEWYGSKPCEEQVATYSTGLGFAASAEYERILSVLRSQPTSGLYKLENYIYGAGVRTMVPGVRHAEIFPTIPDFDANRFLNDIPDRLLFPDHNMPEVRAITLRDVYASVLKGLNHLIRFCSRVVALEEEIGDDQGQIELDLLSMTTGFETSLNPYIAHNPYVAAVRDHFTQAALTSLEERIAAAESSEEMLSILPSLSALQLAIPSLPIHLQEQVGNILKPVNQRLDKTYLNSFVAQSQRGAGKHSSVKRLGDMWRKQIPCVNYALINGFDEVDFTSFYRESVDALLEVPVNRRNQMRLLEIISSIAQSLALSNRLSYPDAPYKHEAERLAAHVPGLIENLRIIDHRIEEWEKVLRLFDAGYKGLGLSYNHHPGFGETIYVILNSQLADGSWGTDGQPEIMPTTQDEYLALMYRLTWACVDVLRPTKMDVSRPGNAALWLM